MLNDFVEAVVAVVERSVSASEKGHFLPRPGGLPGEGYMIDPEGAFAEIPPVVPSRSHVLHALTEMRTAINWAAKKALPKPAVLPFTDSRPEGDEGAVKVQPVGCCDLIPLYDPLRLSVWHNERGAVLIMNDDGVGNNRVELKLTTTEIWGCLLNLDSQPVKLDHREFMSLMRFKICPYMEPTAAGALLEAAKVIDFGSKTEGTSAQSRSQTGFGINVEQSVKAKNGELKDEIVVNVPIYNDELLSERVSVRLSIEINPMSKVFEVKPMIDELPRAWLSVMKTMSNILDDFARDEATGAKLAYVFYGKV